MKLSANLVSIWSFDHPLKPCLLLYPQAWLVKDSNPFQNHVVNLVRRSDYEWNGQRKNRGVERSSG